MFYFNCILTIEHVQLCPAFNLPGLILLGLFFARPSRPNFWPPRAGQISVSKVNEGPVKVACLVLVIFVLQRVPLCWQLPQYHIRATLPISYRDGISTTTRTTDYCKIGYYMYTKYFHIKTHT